MTVKCRIGCFAMFFGIYVNPDLIHLQISDVLRKTTYHPAVTLI